METHNRTESAGLRHSGRMVVGVKQLKKALKNSCATHVYLAKNADPALTEPLAALCMEQKIPVAWVPTMQDLGKQCGIEVGAAAAAAVK